MKKNPHIMLRESDVKKMKREITDDVTKACFVIFFTVMRDKEGYGARKRLPRLYKRISDLADAISKGYVNIHDLEKTLKDEANININFKR